MQFEAEVRIGLGLGGYRGDESLTKVTAVSHRHCVAIYSLKLKRRRRHNVVVLYCMDLQCLADGEKVMLHHISHGYPLLRQHISPTISPTSAPQSVVARVAPHHLVIADQWALPHKAA